MQSAINKIKATLTHRSIIVIVALVGFAFTLPSLTNGLCMDDYQQRTTLLTAPDGNPFEFYKMGTPQTDAMLQRGVLPWWTYPTAKLVFFRPIAQWLMQLDYRLWPNNFVLMHLHSSVWYGLLVAITACVYRKLMPWPLATGLAALMFAIDGGHGGAIAWLANRNVTVAMTGSMLALLCYMRNEWRWQILGCALFALTLACAEAALAITGYFFAYELFLSKQRWSTRLLRLTCYALIALAWLAFWCYRGYGSAGPGFYTDPAADPHEFMRALIYRAPAFLVGQLTFLPIEVIGMLEDSRFRPYILFAVLALCALLAKAFWPLLRRSAVARFFALGMCIATLPISGSQLVGRSMWYVGFGAVGLLALYLEPFLSFDTSAAERTRKRITFFAGAMLVIHFVASPVLFVVGGRVAVILDKYMDTRTVALPNADGSGRHILAISANQYEVNTYYPLLKDDALSLGRPPLRPRPAIEKLRLLTNGGDDFVLSRENENTLVARNENGFAKIRKSEYGFDRGERVMLDDVTITVRETTPQREAREIEFRFNPGALDSYEVMNWNGKRFIPQRLPNVGEEIQISTKSAS